MTTWKIFARMPVEFGAEDYAAECYKHGVIAIGWNEVGNLKQYSEFEEVKDALRKHFSKRAAGSEQRVGAWAASLWAFKEHVRPGDRVLCPDGKTGKTYVGIIESAQPFFDESPIGGACGFAHRRRVKWDSRPAPPIGRLGGKQTVSRIKLNATQLGRFVSRRGQRKFRRSPLGSQGRPDPVWGKEAELRAMQWLESRGESPKDVSTRNVGWDIETYEGQYEVKGRKSPRTRVMLTDNEWRAAKNHRRRYTLLVFTAPDKEQLSRAIPSKYPDPTNTCSWSRRVVYEHFLNE